MKKSSALLIAAALILSSCGALTQMTSSDSGQRFQDGIYSNTPAFRTKAEKMESQAESQALAQKTKESVIYLFGDRKDTVAIPQDMSAMIRYDQKLGGTVVTVGENPYEWRYDLENNYGYYYGPYSIGSSWYWSRHYSPWYSWDFAPWRYRGWYDGWYYSSWYYPYYYGGYYGGWYDPWYWGSSWGWYDPYYNPYYCGWYGGWDPYWGHHHHHGHIGIVPDQHKDIWYGSRNQTSDRVFGSGSTLRGGIGTSSSISRNTSTAGRSSASRVQASAGSSSARGTASRSAAASAPSQSRSSVVRTTPSARSQKIGTYRAATAANSTPVQGKIAGQVSRSQGSAVVSRPASGSQVNHRRPASVTSESSVTIQNGNAISRNGQSVERSSSYDRSTSRSTSNYNSSSQQSRSSFSSGSSGFSRSTSGGGFSGGGASRSGGSAGGRR